RERHAAADHRILEAEFLRGSLVVVIVPAAVEELVAHRFGERLVELDGQRLPGRLVSLPRALLVRRISQRDLAAGLLRQEALVMDAARDQVPGLVPHPHLLRDNLAIAPPVALGHPRAAAQNLSNARRRINLPFLTPPQVAEEVLEVPTLELRVRLLIDDHRSHRSAERRSRRVPRVRLAEALDVVLDHLVGDRELERAEIFAWVYVGRDHECDPPRAGLEYATGGFLCYPVAARASASRRRAAHAESIREERDARTEIHDAPEVGGSPRWAKPSKSSRTSSPARRGKPS